jgi:membrane fusion protein (multidrug efflux system)
LRIHEAGQRTDQAALSAVTQQTDILHAELAKARANLAQAEAGQEAAELNLSYTRITASIAGVVAQRPVRVAPMSRLAAA